MMMIIIIGLHECTVVVTETVAADSSGACIVSPKVDMF
jgi:hypothetical protein